MSENNTSAKEEKKKPLTPPGMSKPGVVPGFYWTMYQPKSYPSSSNPLRGGFRNEQQKKFYMFMTVFKFVKVAAVILLALVIIGFL